MWKWCLRPSLCVVGPEVSLIGNILLSAQNNGKKHAVVSAPSAHSRSSSCLIYLILTKEQGIMHGLTFFQNETIWPENEAYIPNFPMCCAQNILHAAACISQRFTLVLQWGIKLFNWIGSTIHGLTSHVYWHFYVTHTQHGKISTKNTCCDFLRSGKPCRISRIIK